MTGVMSQAEQSAFTQIGEFFPCAPGGKNDKFLLC